jgi:hypothetical protein
VAKKLYAKHKAMYINNCLTNGEQPKPGPLTETTDDNDEIVSSGRPDSHDIGQVNHQISNINMNRDDNKASTSKVEDISYPTGDDNLNINGISVEDWMKAQKLCKYGLSALQFEDKNTAIRNLEECLAILKQ